MPEGDLQLRRRVELLVALRHWYARRGDVHGAWVCCDINIYYKQGDPRVVVAPDVAVALGVDVAAVENKTTYKVWEAGAAPCFALEIASPNTVGTDLHVKPAKYAELGVQEYWRLDPTGGELLDPPLPGERRLSGGWAPAAGRGWAGPAATGRTAPLGALGADRGGARRRRAAGPQRCAGPGSLLAAAQAAPVGPRRRRLAPRQRRPDRTSRRRRGRARRAQGPPGPHPLTRRHAGSTGLRPAAGALNRSTQPPRQRAGGRAQSLNSAAAATSGQACSIAQLSRRGSRRAGGRPSCGEVAAAASPEPSTTPSGLCPGVGLR